MSAAPRYSRVIGRCPRARATTSAAPRYSRVIGRCPRASNNGCHASIRAAAVSHRPHDSHDSHDSARLPINVARNSPTPISNFEIGSLIFRGFQGVIQETRWGITCEIWGGLSCTRGVGPGREAASAQQLFLTTLTILTIRHVYPKMSHVIPPRLFQTLKSDR